MAIAGDPHRLGDAAGLGQVRLHEAHCAVLDQARELEARVVVFAGRQRRGAERCRRLVRAVVLRRERLFEPTDLQLFIGRHHAAHVIDGVAGVGVHQDLDFVADRFADGVARAMSSRGLSPTRSFTAR